MADEASACRRRFHPNTHSRVRRYAHA
jgi:hypothetical protein